MGKRLTSEEFIVKSKLIQNNEYDYSLVKYIKTDIKIKIICPEHGIFEQTPEKHLMGRGCPKCGMINSHNKQRTSQEEFIKDIIETHNNKYDYSLINYINDKTKVKIVCPEHGEFEQSPNVHKKGHGCQKCGVHNKSTTEIFKKKAKLIYPDYDYLKANYINNRTNIKIICPKHGVFEQRPDTHLSGHGCPKCNESKGEKLVREFLIENKYKYIGQHQFSDCRNIKPLPFDFYLPDYNTCIEYNGEQHYKPVKYWGGEETLLLIQKRDKIKDDYCKNNNIKLLIIRYNEDVLKKLNLILSQS